MNKSSIVEKVSEYEINTEAGDIVKNTNKMEWIEVGGGSRFKVLRACKITGDWALYVQMDPGAKFQARGRVQVVRVHMVVHVVVQV